MASETTINFPAATSTVPTTPAKIRKPPKWRPREITPFDPPSPYELRYGELISVYNEEWNVDSNDEKEDMVSSSSLGFSESSALPQSPEPSGTCSAPQDRESTSKQEEEDEVYIKSEPNDNAFTDTQMNLINGEEEKREVLDHLNPTAESKATRKPPNPNSATFMITRRYTPPCVRRKMYHNIPFDMLRELFEWKEFEQFKVPERYIMPLKFWEWDMDAYDRDPRNWYSKLVYREEQVPKCAYDFFQSWATAFVFEGRCGGSKKGGLGGKGPPHLWWMLPEQMRNEWRKAFRSAKEEYKIRQKREIENEKRRIKMLKEKYPGEYESESESEESGEINIESDDSGIQSAPYGDFESGSNIESVCSEREDGTQEKEDTERNYARYHPYPYNLRARRSCSLHGDTGLPKTAPPSLPANSNSIWNGRLRKRLNKGSRR